jgi:adenylate cyclase
VVPDTIQDVLMARIEQLPAEPRHLLQVASVCGREIPLTLLGEVWDGPDPLDAHVHELVQREFISLRTGGETPLCTFTHALTQEVAYRSLDDAARQRLHARAAQALSARFPQLVATHPERLAQHCTEAGLGAQAVRYWLIAGQQARGRSAYPEAIHHLTRGLDVAATLPPSPERFEQELTLQLALGATLGSRKGFAAPEVAQAYTRARQLCHEVGHSPRLFNALAGLQAFELGRGELRHARELADECLTLAAELGDPSMRCRSSNAMGGVLVHLGEPGPAREHLQRAITLVDPATERPAPFHSSVMHPVVWALSYDSWALWLLGHPDRALRANEAALAIVARLDHPHTRTFALHYANVFRQLRRDAGVIPAQADAVIALSSEHGFPHYRALGVLMRGWELGERGEVHEGLAEVRRGLAAFRESGTELGRPYFLGLLAAAHARAGQVKDALGVLTEAIALADERHEHAWDAELHRLRGALVLGDPVRDPRGAAACFREAIAIARGQATRSWELRAALSLGRLLAQAGRRDEGRAAVAEVYGRFTEGFATRDRTEAREFLEAPAVPGDR